MEVAFIPNLKKEKRRESVSRYRKIINGLINRSDGKVTTIQDVAKAFARMKMNG